MKDNENPQTEKNLTASKAALSDHEQSMKQLEEAAEMTKTKGWQHHYI